MKFIKNSLRKSWHLWGLYGLCIIILISHTFYVVKTHQYPEQDEHVYLSFAVQFIDILKHPTKDFFIQIIEVNRNRQPLYGLFLALPLLLVGTAYTYKLVLWLNVLFYMLTIVGTYLLGREFLSRKASFLGAYIFAFYGFPLFYLHFTYSETAATPFVVLSLLFLAKSKYFSKTKYTFWFSIIFLLGSLTRWVVPLFVSGSLLYSLLMGIASQFSKNKRNIKNLLKNIAIFISVGVVLPSAILYLPNIFYFGLYIGSQVVSGPEWMKTIVHPELLGIEKVFSSHSIMFYFNILSQQTVYFFTIFILGFLVGLRHFKKYSFFLFGFVVAYCIFTFGSALKFDRYIMPIYPLMAIISVIIFDHIKNRKLELVLIIVTIAIGFLNFLGASWAIGPMGQQGLKDIVLPEFIRHPRRIYLTPMVWPPRKEELNAELIINTIEQDFGHRSRPPVWLSTFDFHPFDNAVYSIIFYQKRYLLKSPDLNIRHISRNDYLRLFGNIEKADYILVKDSKPIEKYVIDLEDMYIVTQFNKALHLSHGNLPSAFVLIKTISIPLDKTNIKIYKKIRSITNQEMSEFAQLFISLNPQDEEVINKAALEYKL
ncbi:MAG: hypothetical protein Q7K54_00330 [Candidatus Parcubacteria bacterium]|nr:hypothetical protein [Candidatus Parcubacteria bacterium]